MYRFLVVIEKANNNYSAYSPDLPGCVVTGATREEAEKNMYEAIMNKLFKHKPQPLPPTCSNPTAHLISCLKRTESAPPREVHSSPAATILNSGEPEGAPV